MLHQPLGTRSAMCASRNMTSRTCLLISLFDLLLASAASVNITSRYIAAGGRLALCGYYTISYEMWAQSTAAYLYITDTACNSLTVSPCQPPNTPALIPLSCVDRLTCEGGTSQPSAVPLCLVVSNTNSTAPLEVNLAVSGSFTPVNSSSSSSSTISSGSSKGFSTFEVVLVVVGSAAGLVVLVGLMSLTSWLMCFKPPISRQIGEEGDGDLGAKSPSAGMALQRALSASPPLLLPSPATVYPYPLNGGAPYGIATPLSPVPYAMVQPPLSPYYSMRSPSALVPLPSAAYGGLSQPPTSPPPLLSLPQRLAPPPPSPMAQAPPSVAAQSQPPSVLQDSEQQQQQAL